MYQCFSALRDLVAHCATHNAETDKHELPLARSIRVYDTRTFWRSPCMLPCEAVRVLVCFSRNLLARAACKQEGRHLARPGEAAEGVPDAPADIVDGEEEARHDCRVLMLRGGLHNGLRRVRHQRACKTQQDLAKH